MKKLIGTALGLTIVLFPATQSLAHSGGTDAGGCHTNSQTGDRHCHNDGADAGEGPSNSDTMSPTEPDTVRQFTILPPTQTGQESRIEFFEYGYIIVPSGSVDRYMGGLSAAITNAGERGSITALQQFYSLTCRDFNTWQEAQFHYLLGSVPLALDADLDGVACEWLPSTPRMLPYDWEETYRVATTIATTTGQVEIRETDGGLYYVWLEEATVGGIDLPQIVTRPFFALQEARNHYERYYQGR